LLLEESDAIIFTLPKELDMFARSGGAMLDHNEEAL
jgi:hypothetical protein